MGVVETAVERSDLLGESPLWHPAEKVLYWLDIKAPALRRFDPATGVVTDWALPQETGSIALRRDGGFVAGMRDGFAILVPGEDGSVAVELVIDPEGDLPDSRLNDGKCDRQGRYWAGSFHDPAGMPAPGPRTREPVGALYRFDADRTCHRMLDGILVSNSLCWSPDGRTMYFADSPTRAIRAWDYDPTSGAIANPRIFARLPDSGGTPDGSTVDSEGFLWNAQFGGGKLVRYAPDGNIDREIAMPVTRPTCCAFGGADLKTLYVTSGRVMASAAELAAEPLAGALFSIRFDVPGLEEAAWPGD
ncbi:MAG: SMP-30/gluconolactonase/LRE family protein [Alphaproteobacteria bacterium]